MTSVLIRNVDDALHRRLKERAALHSRSLEEEARELLRLGVARQAAPVRENLADLSIRLFGAANGLDLRMPERGSTPARAPVEFGVGGTDGDVG